MIIAARDIKYIVVQKLQIDIKQKDLSNSQLFGANAVQRFSIFPPFSRKIRVVPTEGWLLTVILKEEKQNTRFFGEVKYIFKRENNK